ncbi:uncharacterized protein LOC128218038 [Mya arenaria]|uniref:uncharacterized protein LOC128218038 n=1 Tax=Mya arenaria TaxID=6604 RepID=UPI0022E568A9|nr:uncharacterized protein LOC128218038 [Mya arenaria]
MMYFHTPRNARPSTIVVSITNQACTKSLNNILMNVRTPSCLTQTKQCDHFENVTCGTRTEFKDGCQYKRNKCIISHCIPCVYRLPNCEGKGDGINVDPVRLWTPYYAVCYKERFDKKDQCQVDEDGRTQFFHPERNECVPLDMIPREHGGLMPECGTKVNGGFLDVFGRCDRYAYCQGGKYIGTIKCDVGEVFDELKGGCVPERNACGVCSTHSNCSTSFLRDGRCEIDNEGKRKESPRQT